MKIILLCSFLLYCSFTLVAQEIEFIIIKGRVLEQGSGAPLPYANVALQNNRIGTVSNSRGEFSINIPLSYKEQSLQVSYMGYKTARIPISAIPPNFTCFLEEETELLNEVVVTGLTAEHILNKAIRKISDNYSDTPYISKGFYRLTSKIANKYVRLSEAVFDLYHAASSRNNQFRLEKMRAIKDVKILDNIEIGLKPESVFSFDVVNALEDWDLLNKKGLKNHDFSLEGTYPYNNRQGFVIRFDQKDGLRKSAYRGTLLVDTETFAIVQLDFGLSPKGIQYHKYGNAAQRALMALVDINIDAKDTHYKIDYRKIGNKYYLSKAGIDHNFTVKSSRSQYNFDLDNRVDFFLSAIETDKKEPFLKEEVLGSSEWIEAQNAVYDSVFWENHNILLPDFDFTAVGNTIAANNKASTFKADIEDLLRRYPKGAEGRIDSVLTFYNRKDMFNGNALVEYNGELIFQKSYNNALTENKANTRFRIGSTSKTFTSMLIMLLENEGKLNLSDSVGRFLPDYIHSQITIAQLLSHQSGIPDFTKKEEAINLYNSAWTLDEMANKFCSEPLEFEPGTQFAYSNSGYVLLSLIAEIVTGKTFAQALEDKIFAPLKMESTCHGTSANMENPAVGYLYGKPEPKYFLQNIGGAGGIITTTEDLLRWSRAIDQYVLLPKQKTEELFVPRAAYADWQGDYGVGWMLDRHMFSVSKKHKIHYHPGTDMGFYSMFLKQPDKGITIVLLNNTGDFPRFEITDLILNELNK